VAARVIAYIVVGLFCGESYSYSCARSSFVTVWRHNKKIDLKELRRIDIGYGPKLGHDDRFKR
jgi:hypothetical protein